MQVQLDQFAKAYKNEDIFLFWEEEVELRRTLRQQALPDYALHLKEIEDVDFLFRSLYFSGRKNEFFGLLFQSLQQMPVLNWLTGMPAWLKEDFLAFIPWHIDNIKAAPEELLGLIRIYLEDYHQAFLHIVNVFNLEACNYLLPRTANPVLRRMIAERQKYLLSARGEYSYGILDSIKGLPYPTLFGDKLVLLHQAVDLLHQCNPCNFRDPYSAGRFELLLQCGELMLRAGMIEDCLAFLLDSYEDYREKNRLVDLMEDMAIHKHFSKILRTAIPLYAMIFNPVQARDLAGEIYQRDFAQISPDEASLYYLDLFSSLYSGLYIQQPGVIYELALKSSTISLYRPGEPELITGREARQGLSEDRIQLLQQLYRQKMLSRPHEALATMEIIRLLDRLNLNQLNHSQANHLLNSYLSLWKWVPSPRFLNKQIIEQLVPLAQKHYRQEVERIQSWLDDEDKFKAELISKPELFRKRGEEIRRTILLGHFTGVIK